MKTDKVENQQDRCIIFTDGKSKELGRAYTQEQFTKILDSITFRTEHDIMCMKAVKDGVVVDSQCMERKVKQRILKKSDIL